MNSARRLKVAEAGLAKTEQFPLGAVHPVPQHGERDNILADIAIGNPDRGSLQNGWMRLQNFIDLLGRDVHSALDDQFLRAADDKDVPVLVPVGEVAGMQPPVGVERSRGSRRVLVIALHHPFAAQQNLARLASRQFSALAIDNPGLKAPRQPWGSDLVFAGRHRVREDVAGFRRSHRLNEWQLEFGKEFAMQ